MEPDILSELEFPGSVIDEAPRVRKACNQPRIRVESGQRFENVRGNVVVRGQVVEMWV
jgi:hypothetical protein